MMQRTVFITILLLAIPIIVYAHSGGTDSSGCHTCRTNCWKWGLNSGEYHCHRSKGVAQPKAPVRSHKGTPGYTEPAPDYATPKTVNTVRTTTRSSVDDVLSEIEEVENNNKQEPVEVENYKRQDSEEEWGFWQWFFDWLLN